MRWAVKIVDVRGIEGVRVRRQLRRATDRLVAQFRPQRVILFGSQARGTADARSDVDSLVICAFDSKWESRRTLMVAMDRALCGLGFARDGIMLTPEEFERDRPIPGAGCARRGVRGRCCMKLPAMLLEICAAHAPWAGQLSDAEALSPYAATARYPGGDVEVNEIEARRAVEIAERVREVVRGCPPARRA